MKNKYIYLDGSILFTDEKYSTTLSPWLLDGRGVFETMRSLNNKVFFLNRHLNRLFSSLEKINIMPEYSRGRIVLLLQELLQLNRFNEARVRISVWQEKNKKRISIIVSEYKELSDKMYRKGYSGIIYNEKCTLLGGVKSIQYRDFWKAYKFAEKKSYDEAIIINKRKEIVEGSRTNIFFGKNDSIITPSLKCGCLNGITRQIVLKLAKEEGLKVKICSVNEKELCCMDESFLTNSIIGVMPLSGINQLKYNDGNTGRITAKIMTLYNQYRREKG